MTDEELKITGDHFSHVLFGGDQLTVARARGSERVRMNSDNGVSRLEGLIPVIEDWHAKVVLLHLHGDLMHACTQHHQLYTCL